MHFKESKKDLVFMTFRECVRESFYIYIYVCVCQILTCKATWVFVRSQSDYQGKMIWFTLVCQHFLESFCIFWCLQVMLGGLCSSCNFRPSIIWGCLGWCALKILQGIYRYVKRSKVVWSLGRFSGVKSRESKGTTPQYDSPQGNQALGDS